MKFEHWFALAVGAFVGGVTVFVATAAKGSDDAKNFVYSQAASKGFGEFRLDKATGQIAFEWRDEKEMCRLTHAFTGGDRVWVQIRENGRERAYLPSYVAENFRMVRISP